MDDLTPGGAAGTVAADVDYLRHQEESTGLRINASKCEIISRGPTPSEEPFEGFIPLKPDEAELLFLTPGIFTTGGTIIIIIIIINNNNNNSNTEDDIYGVVMMT